MAIPSNSQSIIATAHPDRCIRLWDPRIKNEKQMIKKLISHKEWISSLSWHPTNKNIFLSGSYDHCIKLWDIRSNIPLDTITSHSDKILCVCWSGTSSFLSGAADSKLFTFSLNFK